MLKLLFSLPLFPSSSLPLVIFLAMFTGCVTLSQVSDDGRKRVSAIRGPFAPEAEALMRANDHRLQQQAMTTMNHAIDKEMYARLRIRPNGEIQLGVSPVQSLPISGMSRSRYSAQADIVGTLDGWYRMPSLVEDPRLTSEGLMTLQRGGTLQPKPCKNTENPEDLQEWVGCHTEVLKNLGRYIVNQ